MKTIKIVPLMLAVAAVLAFDACADGTAPLPNRIAASARREAPVLATRPVQPTRVYGGRSADSALRAIAATWAKRGDRTLVDHIARRDAHATPVKGSGPSNSEEPSEIDESGQRPAAVTASSSDITPSARPTAVIYSSNTTAFLSGTSGVASAYVIYYGNMARTTMTTTASYSDNLYPTNSTTTPHQELGSQYPCVGNAWQCAWVFDMTTLVTVGFARDCGTTLDARSDHAAWWQAPVIAGYFSGATWGFAYAQNALSRASTSPCAPTQTSSTCRATTTNTTLFSPTLDPGGIAVPCNQPSGGTVGGGATCTQQYVYIEMRSNGVWQVIWQGWTNVCT